MICRRIKTWFHELRAYEAGSQVVELALTLPVLLALFCGMIEGGRILFTHAAFNFAVEEAARFATVNPDATILNIETIARRRLIVINSSGTVGFDVTSELNAVDQTSLVTVEID